MWSLDVDRDVRLLTASPLQAMGSTDSGSPLCSCVVCSDWCISILLLFLLAGPLACRVFVVVFLDRRHPRSWNFNSVIPVDVIRVQQSYVNCLFHLPRVPVVITINKLDFVPKRLVSGFIGVSRVN